MHKLRVVEVQDLASLVSCNTSKTWTETCLWNGQGVTPMKKINRSKLGLNKDSLKHITEDSLREITGGTIPTVSATCTPHTVTRDGQGYCV